jgi:CheY-like chemotaxis protein
VLVVDDDSKMRVFLSEVLQRAGFAVAVAESGRAAITAVGHGSTRWCSTRSWRTPGPGCAKERLCTAYLEAWGVDVVETGADLRL